MEIKSSFFLGFFIFAIISPGDTGFSNCTQPGLVALTFDDGPASPETGQVLDVLGSHGVKATFFINGLYNHESDLTRFKAVITRIYNEGHQLGSHTWNHANLTGLPESELLYELEHLAELVRSTLGVNMTVWRPPYGEFTAGMDGLIYDKFRYDMALWNVDTRDWDIDNPLGVEAYRAYYGTGNDNSTAKPSCIGLHHDFVPNSASLTNHTIHYLKGELGLRLVTMAECLGREQMHIPAPVSGDGGDRKQFSAISCWISVILVLQTYYWSTK